MKRMLLTLFLAIGNLNVFAITPEELAGTYLVEVSQLSPLGVNYIVRYEEDGKVDLWEIAMGGVLECEGEAVLEAEDEVVRAEVTCENGRTFVQTVHEMNRFEDGEGGGFDVKLSSSLYGDAIVDAIFNEISDQDLARTLDQLGR